MAKVIAVANQEGGVGYEKHTLYNDQIGLYETHRKT